MLRMHLHRVAVDQLPFSRRGRRERMVRGDRLTGDLVEFEVRKSGHPAKRVISADRASRSDCRSRCAFFRRRRTRQRSSVGKEQERVAGFAATASRTAVSWPRSNTSPPKISCRRLASAIHTIPFAPKRFRRLSVSASKSRRESDAPPGYRNATTSPPPPTRSRIQRTPYRRKL